MKVRATIIVKGRVSSVGFREFVDERAFPLELSGFVRELPDGTAEVVCEGDRDVLQAFIKRISIVKYPVRVTGVEVRYSDATGEFPDFRIVREGGPISELCDRLEGALRCIRDMQQGLVPLDEMRERQARLLVVQHKALERLDRTSRLQQQSLEVLQRMLQKQDRSIKDGRSVADISGRLLKKQEAMVAALRLLDRHEEERLARLGRRQERLASSIGKLVLASGARKKKHRIRKDAMASVSEGAESSAVSDDVAPGPAPVPTRVEGGIAG
jgi:acylphosphatase